MTKSAILQDCLPRISNRERKARPVKVGLLRCIYQLLEALEGCPVGVGFGGGFKGGVEVGEEV